MTRIAINGFGRIGRSLLRQIFADPASGIEIGRINDIAPLDMCAYLLRYDSVFGPFPGEVRHDDGALVVNGIRIPFSTERDLRNTDLSDIDVVLECTGRATERDHAEAGLAAGARAVLISGPSTAADVTVVLGANDDDLGDARIVSNASCTTNAVAPLLRLIDDSAGIERAHVTTIHCYTGSQPTVDAPAASFERSRAAAVSMVPTSTSAAHQVIRTLPRFQDRLAITAVRVPAISVSSIDAVIQLSRPIDTDAAAWLETLVQQSPVISSTWDPCVSTDMRARPESLVLALPETRYVAPNQLRLFGWYDNEWGFSARMLDMTRKIAARL